MAKKTTPKPTPRPERTWLYGLAFAGIVFLAFYGRTAGLYRELDQGCTFHPDEPKQVVALHNYLENRYIWYNHSLFYDGYPFFLNHLDEWIIRGARGIQHLVHRHFRPGTPLPPYPDTFSLYYWARFLRALYGTVVVILTYFIARLIGLKRSTALFAMLLQALAPLALAVSHAATGDIGVDLFSALMILFVALFFNKPRRLYLFLAGLCVGFGFAAKYQGMLMALVMVVAFILYVWRCRKPLRTLFAAAGITLLGTALGIAAAIPQLVFAFDRSWRDIRDNFIFIAHYGVDEAFLEQPALTRLLFSMTHNPPRLVDALGWTVVLTALLGLVLSIMALRKTEGDRRPPLCLAVSIFAFPLLAGLLSLSGKPAVQTIHFAYVQMPLCLAAAFALHYLWATQKHACRAGAALLGMILIIELGGTSLHELYFWYRPDMKALGAAYERDLCLPDHAPVVKNSNHPQSDTVRHLHVETAHIPVFRNRPRVVNLPNKDAWQQCGAPPVPTIPWASNPHWIMMNGPVFPRNDRYVKIPGRGATDRSLVFTNIPPVVQVGLRCGYLPSQVTLEIGGKKETILLTPYEQRILAVEPDTFRTIPGFAQENMDPVYIVPVAMHSDLGDVWAIFMSAPIAVEHVVFFGGDPAAEVPSDRGLPPEQLIRMLAPMRYLEGQAGLTLNGTNPDRPDRALLQEERFPLPCGVYRLVADIKATAPDNRLALRLKDRTGLADSLETEQAWDLPPGLHTLTFTFSKPFAPFECMIEAVCSAGIVHINDWTLTPDTEQILRDVSALREEGVQPAWRRLQPEPPAPAPLKLVDVLYTGGFKLDELHVPDRMSHSESVHITALFDPHAIRPRNFEEYYFFLHFIDSDKKRVGQIDFPVFQAAFDPAHPHPVSRPLPDAIPPGEYTLYAGIWNGRTEQRVDVEYAPPNHPVWKNKVPAGTVVVTP